VVDTTGARDLVRHCVEACRVILITTVNFWFILMILIGSSWQGSNFKQRAKMIASEERRTASVAILIKGDCGHREVARAVVVDAVSVVVQQPLHDNLAQAIQQVRSMGSSESYFAVKVAYKSSAIFPGQKWHAYTRKGTRTRAQRSWHLSSVQGSLARNARQSSPTFRGAATPRLSKRQYFVRPRFVKREQY
jgi:hypothetical protein